MNCPKCDHGMDRHIFDQNSQNVPCTVRGCQCLSEIENAAHWVTRTVPASGATLIVQRMWMKFHRETDCGAGEDGMHWKECEDFTEWMKEAYIGTN